MKSKNILNIFFINVFYHPYFDIITYVKWNFQNYPTDISNNSLHIFQMKIYSIWTYTYLFIAGNYRSVFQYFTMSFSGFHTLRWALLTVKMSPNLSNVCWTWWFYAVLTKDHFIIPRQLYCQLYIFFAVGLPFLIFCLPWYFSYWHLILQSSVSQF